jgi:hypothetical protein
LIEIDHQTTQHHREHDEDYHDGPIGLHFRLRVVIARAQLCLCCPEGQWSKRRGVGRTESSRDDSHVGSSGSSPVVAIGEEEIERVAHRPELGWITGIKREGIELTDRVRAREERRRWCSLTHLMFTGSGHAGTALFGIFGDEVEVILRA